MAQAKSAGALAGTRVIDLSRVLGGPFCSQFLGDHGADVIKVEPPQGDETRGWGPPFLEDTASYFIGVNRNKRGIALDLSKPDGRAVLFRLLETADVLLENFKTGTLERWGMGYEGVLKDKFPRLVHCRVSGFGADGPLGGYAGYDAAIQAMAGLMSLNGEAGGDPLRVGVLLPDPPPLLGAALGILLALQERAHSGRGQSVEATLYDSALALLHPYAANWFMTRTAPKRTGNAHPNVAPYDQFQTKTKRIFLAVGNNRQYARLCAEIGRPELAEDARFRDVKDRNTNRAALRGEIEAALAAIDGEALTLRLLDRGVPCGVVQDLPDALTHPHTLHRGMIYEQGAYRAVGNPVKLSRTPAGLHRLPPRFGEANRAVLKEAGFSEAEIDRLVESGIVGTTLREAAQD
jgi:crotonobetainyl-CoA:carnitine CoA-transferase CaiB-like acyl-CoA transferase